MIVTDKKLYLDGLLKSKLDLMIKRMKGKRDNVVLIDGDEGEGKSNIESLIGYYIAYTMKRKLDLNNMFFDLNALTDYAIKTEEQVILWDEGALGGLAADWWDKNQKRFIKLLMVARKRKHFFVICIPKFFKLNEYLVVDRSVALINVYSARQMEQGRFSYFNKRAKENLYYDWRKSRKRNYFKFRTFFGRFAETLPKVFDEKEYDKKKDAAILSIGGTEAKSERLLKREIMLDIIKNLGDTKKMFKNQKELAKFLGIGERTLIEYNRVLRLEATAAQRELLKNFDDGDVSDDDKLKKKIEKMNIEVPIKKVSQGIPQY